MALCPRCNFDVASSVWVPTKPVTLDGDEGHRLKGLVYICASCGVALGIGPDPTALQAELLKEIEKLISKK
jgi:hypothetical protein